MKPEFLAFAREHLADDTARLLLSAARYPGIDMPAAVQQIEGLRTAADKWPSLAQNAEVVYPPRVNREQASSDATAAYKAAVASRLLSGSAHSTSAADITGGMGIDTMALSTTVHHMHYVERNADLCRLAAHNFAAVGRRNIEVHCADGLQWLAEQECPLDLVYVDPSRRDSGGQRAIAFEHCQPDIVAARLMLSTHANRLIVKASPMIDIATALSQLGAVAEVHVVAVEGECKEVLLVSGNAEEPQIVCANLRQSGTDTFSFTATEEHAATPTYCQELSAYLYEPNAAIMKAGAFKLIGTRYGLAKLGRNTHLYTSDHLVADFPGRIFEVETITSVSVKAVRKVLPDGAANVIVRNFPATASTLGHRLGLRGGTRCLVATTLATTPIGIVCHMVAPA